MKFKQYCGLTFVVLLLSLLTATLNVKSVKAALPTFYIREDGSVEPSTALISSADNVTYVFTGDIDGFIRVERSNIIIDGNGHSLQGDGTGDGFALITPNNVTIQNTQIKSFYYGIFMQESSTITISGNIMTNNSYAINFYGCSSSHILENVITDNEQGIFLSYSSRNNIIERNTITDNRLGGVGVWVTSNGNCIQENDISRNNFTSDAYGIMLSTSSSLNISKNNVRDNYNDIILASSPNNIITGNNITGSELYGIYLYKADNNTISGNNIVKNKFYGINFRLASNCTTHGNTITNNQEGVTFFYSSNNTFYHNNFVENVRQINFNTSCSEFWDNNAEGNYWSDHNGTDLNSGFYQNETGSDGISDASYILNENNDDRYPLMGMFSDFDATPEHHVQTICNSSISNFQFNGTAISFDVSSEDNTIGFCRICIPTVLVNDPYRVFVNGTEMTYTLLLCSNRTHSYLYFTYNHSTQEIIIIPESSPFLIMSLFIVAVLLAVVKYRRKQLNLRKAQT